MRRIPRGKFKAIFQDNLRNDMRQWYYRHKSHAVSRKIINHDIISCIQKFQCLKTKYKQVKSFNTAHVVKQMSTLMLKYAIYAFSVEK